MAGPSDPLPSTLLRPGSVYPASAKMPIHTVPLAPSWHFPGSLVGFMSCLCVRETKKCSDFSGAWLLVSCPSHSTPQRGLGPNSAPRCFVGSPSYLVRSRELSWP